MKNPAAINLKTPAEVEAQGWAAEARDDDGHLCSTMGWVPDFSLEENIRSLGAYVAEWEENRHVKIFPANIRL